MPLRQLVRKLLDGLPAPLALADGDGRIVDVSPSFAALLGYEARELQGAPFSDFVVGGRLQERVHASLVGEPSSHSIDVALARRDGERVPVHLGAVDLRGLAGPQARTLISVTVPPSREREAEQRLERVLDRMSDGFCALDHAFRFTYVNPVAEAYFQRPREQLLAKSVFDIFPAMRGTDLEHHFRRAMSERVPLEFELRSPVTRKWISYKLDPSLFGMSIYFRDVDAQKRGEAKLRESEAMFRSLFENSLDAILLTAPDGRVFAANSAACDMLGRSEAEIRRLGRDGVIDRSDPRLTKLFEERRSAGRARGEVRAIRADGTTFPVELSSALFADANGDVRASMTFFDLTERNRAREALSLLAEASASLGSSLDYERTLQNVVRLATTRVADLCVIDLEEEGTIRRVAAGSRDPRWKALVRIGRVRERDPQSRTGVDEVFRTGRPVFVREVTSEWIERAARDEAQQETMLAVGLTSLILVPMVAHGRRMGVLSLGLVHGGRRFDEADLRVAQGIADRAATAIANSKLYSAAIEAKQLRDEVLGIVSHDLRGPLSSIALAAAVLEKRGGGPQVAAIQRGIERATRLIQDLLVSTQLDAGKLPLEKSEETAASLVDEVVALFLPQAQAKSVHLHGTVATDLPPLEVDRHRMVQALSNLVGNAVKFTPEGGHVEVRASALGRDVLFSVTDTGPGIGEEQLAHLFDRFWQGAHARRAGAGLGLAIVKGIVQMHGGNVVVESAVGRGTTFTIRLPRELERTDGPRVERVTRPP